MKIGNYPADNELYGLILTGTEAARPAAGTADRFYWATDTEILYRDTGAAWVETARGESVTRLAQLSERAHGSLTGVGVADHHAKTGDNEVFGLILSDIIGNRPAAGTANRFFWATDEHILYRDTGAAWVKAAVADYPDLDSIPASFTPSAHKDTHDPQDGADPLDTAAGSTIQPDDAAAVGTSHSLARADHKHAIVAATPLKVGAANAEGASTSFARADHVHEREHAKYLDTEAVSAAEAAGLALASGKNIKLISALAANDTWSGLSAILTAGAVLALGELVYVGNDSEVHKTDANAVATMPGIALATCATTDGNPFEFLLLGFMRHDDWNWTPGGLLYASLTAGALTQDVSGYTTNDQVQVVGVAITADIIYFNPSFELVEIA